ncbi:Dihydroflavonol-4-reductase [Hordeum vulgare]|nr:Dihydroflavonol-4-reductase [Hordeum vulgare]
MPPSLVTALAFIMGNEAHYSILKQVQLVHLDNLCNAMTFLFEHPEANGPYISSSQDATIHVLARMLGDRFPEYDIPKKFAGVDDNFQPINFSKKPERRARGWGWRGGGWRRRKDLHRFVKWPKVVRIQCQRRILKQRLKVPPTLHQFTRTLDKNIGE